MITFEGAYCKDVKIFTDNIEEEALKTVHDIADSKAFEDAKIRIMPDVHSGNGIVIGFSCPVGAYVNPNHIGVDIGCQMTTVRLSRVLTEGEYAKFEKEVKKAVPMGFAIHSKRMYNDKEFYKWMTDKYNVIHHKNKSLINPIKRIDEDFITNMCRRLGLDIGKFYKSIGTVGGGNHFIEYGEGDNGNGYLTIHCGSRNFGLKVCKYWDTRAKHALSREDKKRIVQYVKDSGFPKTEWQNKIKEFTEEFKGQFIDGYLSGDDLNGYMSDMVVATLYASYNHKVILDIINDIISKRMSITLTDDRINTMHNYIDFDDLIIRKGAIRSVVGEKMIIPFNMRDGIAICDGKSNPDWNYSAPHGAGRLMSRAQAKKNISIDEFKESMSNVYSTTVCEETKDESPMAYKPMDEILELIEPTANILFMIKPKINIKAIE